MLFWVFAILVLVNGTVDNDKVILYYRYEIAGLPINMLDFGLAAMAIIALATLNQPKFPVDRVHPALKWSIGVLIGSLLMGVLGSVRNDVELRFWVTVARNVAMLPLCMFLGYQVIDSPKRAKWAAYVMVLASLGSALFVLLFVRETGENLGAMSTFDKLRSTSYGGDAGLYAAAFLAFAMVASVRFLPYLLMWLLIPFAAVGFYSLPHRSGWLAGGIVLIFATMLLPKVKLGRKLAISWLLLLGVASTMLAAIGGYTRMTGKNYGEYVQKRLVSLLPGEQEGVRSKAWDTRLPGIKRELQIWMSNPAMGQGFGIQMQEETTGVSAAAGGFRHNVWTASLAESGVLGLLGYMVPPILALVLGWRLVRQATDLGTFYIGALGGVVGCWSFFISFMTLSINTQRQAIPLGLLCGMVFKCRAMQLTLAREHGYGEYGQTGELPLEYEGEYAHGYGYPAHGYPAA